MSRCWLVTALLLVGDVAFAQAAERGTLASEEIWEPLLRMGLSLALVLAILAGCAWLAKRLLRLFCVPLNM